MKKRLFAILAACVLVIGLAIPAAAKTIESNNDMHVTFKQDKDGNGYMEDTFSENPKAIDDYLSDYMQPGDTAVFTVNVGNEYPQEVDFWMNSTIIQSLEDTAENAANGGYEYILEYTNPNDSSKSRYLYYKGSVGGEGSSEGLMELNDDVNEIVEDVNPEEDYFYLDSFSKGEGGYLTLKVTLDGESQGNDYQSTLADLGMNFAVELQPNETQPETTPTQTTTTPKTPKTGDETNTAIYFIILAAAGVVILVFAILMAKKRRKGSAS